MINPDLNRIATAAKLAEEWCTRKQFHETLKEVGTAPHTSAYYWCKAQSEWSLEVSDVQRYSAWCVPNSMVNAGVI